MMKRQSQSDGCLHRYVPSQHRLASLLLRKVETTHCVVHKQVHPLVLCDALEVDIVEIVNSVDNIDNIDIVNNVDVVDIGHTIC